MTNEKGGKQRLVESSCFKRKILPSVPNWEIFGNPINGGKTLPTVRGLFFRQQS